VSGGIASPVLTSALDGVEWSASSPCRFTSEERAPRYALDKRLSRPQIRSGFCEEEKNLALPEIEPGPSNPPLYRMSYPDYFPIPEIKRKVFTHVCSVEYFLYAISLKYSFPLRCPNQNCYVLNIICFSYGCYMFRLVYNFSITWSKYSLFFSKHN
jgi:hypothetical protein